MRNVVVTIMLALFVGVSAAFFRPAEPRQIEAVTKPAMFSRGGSQTMMDSGLDNPDIEEDTNITPARKCGFCMGVS